MGPDLEPKDKSNTMMGVVSSNNENGGLPHDLEDKFMHCASNCEDQDFGEETSSGVGQAKISKGNEDMEINITECTNSRGDGLAVAECQDATENSSSFGGTVTRESKKPVVATAAMDDDDGNLGTKLVNSNDDFGFNDGFSCLKFRDSDTWSEQILRKIDLVQSQACKLKTRVDKVVNESPRKFSSINMLSSLAPCNALTVLSPGEVTPCLNMIEGRGQLLVGISYENAAKEQLHNFQSGLTQQAKELQIPIKKLKTISTVLAPRDDPRTKPSAQQNVKLSPTSRSKGPNNKRKRGKRKSGTGRWSRRSSG